MINYIWIVKVDSICILINIIYCIFFIILFHNTHQYPSFNQFNLTCLDYITKDIFLGVFFVNFTAIYYDQIRHKYD